MARRAFKVLKSLVMNEAPRRQQMGYSKDHNKVILLLIGFLNLWIVLQGML
jgi:hypothetical protein